MRSWKFLCVFVGFLGLSLFTTRVVQAKVSPWSEWTLIRTPHFRVHYLPAYREVVNRLTFYLEEAYGVLSRDMRWELADPADVVVRGDTDIPNGYSMNFPANRLVIHAVPFSPLGSIGEYDNWIRTLAYHELTHLIANDATTGVFATGRKLFGSAAKMNCYQPQWLIEGLAVYEETIHGSYGRGRSVFFDTALRTAVSRGLIDSEDHLLGVTLDRLDQGVPLWPGPLTPYLYGYVLQTMVAEVGGPEAPGALSIANSSRLPFLINPVAREVLGKDYYQLWSDTVARLKEISDVDLASIRSQSVTPVASLTSIGRMTGGPVVSEDGETVFLVRDSYREGVGLSELELKTRTVRRLSHWEFGGGSQLRRVGRRLLYSRFQRYEEFQVFSDVFLWDVDRGKEIQVTSGHRAMDPDSSADFEWKDGRISSGALAYVKNLGDGNQGIAHWDGKTERIVYRGWRFERVAGPAWGRGRFRDWIVFTLKANEENERLLAINARSGVVRELTRQAPSVLRISEVTPSWTAAGDVLFASSDGGVFNLYRIVASELTAVLDGVSSSAAVERITNLETGAVFPVDAGLGRTSSLYAMVYGSNGFDLALISDPRPISEPVPRLRSLHDKLLKRDVSVGSSGALSSPDQSNYANFTSEDHSILPGLWPKYWLPFAGKLTDGFTLGASTSGSDAIERHSYAASLAWDSRSDFPVYGIIYQYDGLYPSIRFERHQLNKYLGLFQMNNRVVQNALGFIYPIGNWRVSMGGTISQSRFFDQGSTSGGLQARFSHGDVQVFPDSIDRVAGESGHRADMTLTGYFAGDEQFSSIEARLEQRIPSLWPQHFFRAFGSVGRSTNKSLAAFYLLGGGESVVSESESYLVRGYRPGAIYGRTLGTLNVEYWLPIVNVFRGRGTLPAFYERAKMKIFADVGSGEFVAGEQDGFTHWPVGVGVHVIQDLKVLNRIPFSFVIGFDWGLSDSLGGEKQIVFGLFSRIN